MLTCVLLHPFCFHGFDSSTALVALEGKRARFVNWAARGLGIEGGRVAVEQRITLGSQYTIQSSQVSSKVSRLWGSRRGRK